MTEQNFGPAGGSGGQPFFDCIVPAGAHITAIHMLTGWYVDALWVKYRTADGQELELARVGGISGDEHVFVLDPDEHLVGISGQCGDYVDSICFHTNKRTSQLFGGSGGDTAYSLMAPDGSEVVGFYGRADWYLDSIGIATRPYAALPATPEPVKAARQRPVRAAQKTESPAPAVAPVGQAAVADDLTKIEGIGPKIAETLAAAGLTTFAALAATPASQLRDILAATGKRFRLADPTTWPEQASLAAKGDWAGLAAFQSTLKAGRKK